MSVPSYPFHSLLLKLPNKGINFQFPPLKLPNKEREEYSKMILFIHFHSIPFPPPKRSLKENNIENILIEADSNIRYTYTMVSIRMVII